MLAILELRKKFLSAMLLPIAVALVSCATHKETTLVDDPADRQDSLVPWNKPEKWESGGQLAGMTDRR